MAYIPAQRRELIRDALGGDQVVVLRELAERLGVSLMTVRRDVAALEAEGLAEAVRGGVRAVGRRPPASRVERELLEAERKAAIARRAAGMIRDGMSLYLDAGTTCLALARAMPRGLDLTVVTCDLHTALLLGVRGGVEVILPGGRLDPESGSVDGALAVSTAESVATDLCFVSTAAWNVPRGVTTTTLDKLAVKRAAAAASSRAVLLADATKYGAADRYRVAGLDAFAVIVSDDGLGAAARAALSAAGPELLIAV